MSERIEKMLVVLEKELLSLEEHADLVARLTGLLLDRLDQLPAEKKAPPVTLWLRGRGLAVVPLDRLRLLADHGLRRDHEMLLEALSSPEKLKRTMFTLLVNDCRRDPEGEITAGKLASLYRIPRSSIQRAEKRTRLHKLEHRERGRHDEHIYWKKDLLPFAVEWLEALPVPAPERLAKKLKRRRRAR